MDENADAEEVGGSKDVSAASVPPSILVPPPNVPPLNVAHPVPPSRPSTPWSTYVSISLALLSLIAGGGSFLINMGVLKPFAHTSPPIAAPGGKSLVSTLPEASVERVRLEPTIFESANPDVEVQVARNPLQPRLYTVSDTAPVSKPNSLWSSLAGEVKILGKLPAPGPTDLQRYHEERKAWTLLSKKRTEKGTTSIYLMPNGGKTTEYSPDDGGAAMLYTTYPGDKTIHVRSVWNLSDRQFVESAARTVASMKRAKGKAPIALVSDGSNGVYTVR